MSQSSNCPSFHQCVKSIKRKIDLEAINAELEEALEELEIYTSITGGGPSMISDSIRAIMNKKARTALKHAREG